MRRCDTQDKQGNGWDKGTGGAWGRVNEDGLNQLRQNRQGKLLESWNVRHTQTLACVCTQGETFSLFCCVGLHTSQGNSFQADFVPLFLFTVLTSSEHKRHARWTVHQGEKLSFFTLCIVKTWIFSGWFVICVHPNQNEQGTVHRLACVFRKSILQSLLSFFVEHKLKGLCSNSFVHCFVPVPLVPEGWDRKGEPRTEEQTVFASQRYLLLT